MTRATEIRGLTTSDDQPVYMQLPESCAECKVVILADALSLVVAHIKPGETPAPDALPKRFRGSLTPNDISAWLEEQHA